MPRINSYTTVSPADADVGVLEREVTPGNWFTRKFSFVQLATYVQSKLFGTTVFLQSPVSLVTTSTSTGWVTSSAVAGVPQTATGLIINVVFSSPAAAETGTPVFSTRKDGASTQTIIASSLGTTGITTVEQVGNQTVKSDGNVIDYNFNNSTQDTTCVVTVLGYIS